MPKRPCMHRAEWRLLRGKPAYPLPAHYQLDCDYGTSLVAIYRQGEGDNPLYLCELHAAAEREAAATLERDRDSVCAADAPSVESLPISDSQDARNDRAQDADDGTRMVEAAAGNASEAEGAGPERHSGGDASVRPAADRPGNDSATKSHRRRPSAPARARTETTGNVGAKLRNSAPKPNAPASPEAEANGPATTGAAKVSSSSKGSARDLTYGNPAKALVDETIWNIKAGDWEAYRAALRQGKPVMEAAQAAGGQLAIVHRKINEYAVKIEALLSASKATISVNDAIHSVLERETLRVIGDTAMREEEKDASVERLGGFQEWINRGLNGEMTPLQAHGIAIAIGDRANWGVASAPVSDELRRVHGAVYGSLRDAVRAAVPDVRDPEERLANLYAAKSDLEAMADAQIAAAGDPGIAASAFSSAREEKFAQS